MRKIIISFCILLAALSLKAQSISGIRIDGGDAPIIVYMDGTQMCLPTASCFIANLRAGNYTVEVYASRASRPGERAWKGQRLYSSRVYFNGSEIKEIFVDSRNENRPNRPGQPEYYPDHGGYGNVMNSRLFDKFISDVKNATFESDQIKLIQTALINTDFTSTQCLRLVNLYSFDSEKMKIMKMIYPRIVDKQAFFTVINALDFSTNKSEMEKFMRNYNRR